MNAIRSIAYHYEEKSFFFLHLIRMDYTDRCMKTFGVVMQISKGFFSTFIFVYLPFAYRAHFGIERMSEFTVFRFTFFNCKKIHREEG